MNRHAFLPLPFLPRAFLLTCVRYRAPSWSNSETSSLWPPFWSSRRPGAVMPPVLTSRRCAKERSLSSLVRIPGSPPHVVALVLLCSIIVPCLPKSTAGVSLASTTLASRTRQSCSSLVRDRFLPPSHARLDMKLLQACGWRLLAASSWLSAQASLLCKLVCFIQPPFSFFSPHAIWNSRKVHVGH